MSNGDSATASQRFVLHQRAARKKRFAKAAGLILLAVAAGAVIGVGGTLLYFQNTVKKRGAQAIAEAMMNRLGGLVALTPDEETRVREIVDARLKEVDDMRRRRFEEIWKVFRSMDAPMEPVLGAERMEVWRKYREERFERRQDDMNSR